MPEYAACGMALLLIDLGASASQCVGKCSRTKSIASRGVSVASVGCCCIRRVGCGGGAWRLAACCCMAVREPFWCEQVTHSTLTKLLRICFRAASSTLLRIFPRQSCCIHTSTFNRLDPWKPDDATQQQQARLTHALTLRRASRVAQARRGRPRRQLSFPLHPLLPPLPSPTLPLASAYGRCYYTRRICLGLTYLPRGALTSRTGRKTA